MLDFEREERESIVYALDGASVKIRELLAIINRHERRAEEQDRALQQADNEAQALSETEAQLRQAIQDIAQLRDQERDID